MFTQRNQPRYGKSASSGNRPEGLFNATVSKVVFEGTKTLFFNAIIEAPSTQVSVALDAEVGSPSQTGLKPRIYARVPRLTGNFEYGPIDFAGQIPKPGDSGFVGLREGRPDEVVLLTTGGEAAAGGSGGGGGDDMMTLMLMGG